MAGTKQEPGKGFSIEIEYEPAEDADFRLGELTRIIRIAMDRAARSDHN